jgi:hypothetical protein
LLPAAKILDFVIPFVSVNASIKIVMRNEGHQLAKNVLSLIHGPKISQISSNRLNHKISSNALSTIISKNFIIQHQNGHDNL